MRPSSVNGKCLRERQAVFSVPRRSGNPRDRRAAARVLLAYGAEPPFVVAATHGLLVGDAAARLERLPVRSLVTTDSLPQSHPPAPAMQTESVAPLLADAIGRLHQDQPLADLLVRT